MRSAEIRSAYLSFFEKRGHTVVPSASLLANDPTLLFTNAGMVPFKDVFLGNEQRSYARATSAQRCLRVSGKHNDLEEVGISPRHHTFFEMLGNFSFGDYFKEEAIAFAWELLTKEFGLPPDKMHPTVYEEDDESARIWSKIIGIPADTVVRLGADDNFWSMGDTGPCGPNSEIMYDRTGRCLRDGSDCPLTCDCDRWWEIWNLVFMTYDRSKDGALTPLPKTGVDTGMGFERMCAVLQGVESNYETDVFTPLIEQLRELTGDSDITSERRGSYRAVADHARAVSFLIADGLMPSNDGRGYVLRRILRRASYQGNLLGLDRPFLSDICSVVIDTMGDAYPELLEASPRILELVSDEEERFLNTLDAGLTRLEQIIGNASLRTAQGKRPLATLKGEEAFRLHDTYGFPLDLTRKVLESRGWAVDDAGFEKALEEQRERARGALARERGQDEALLAATNDLEPTRFVGYETMTSDATALVVHTNEDVVDLVLDVSPFYAEGGGQVGDLGQIVGTDGEAQIEAVRRLPNGVFVHSGRVARGRIAKSDNVRAEVDESTRRATMRNHTATHLLHRALRIVLGPQAKQAGSLVAPDRLRFDFLHSKPLTDDELHEVERLVREQVLLDRAVQTNVMALQEALSLGADAMFDEKYGEQARVVTVPNGDEPVDQLRTTPFSRELCGGTHCHATGEIGAFAITEQRSVGAGVRRIEAVTGFGAYEWLDQRRQVVDELSREYNVPPAELPERLRALRERAEQRQTTPTTALPDPSDVLARAEQRDGTLLIIDKLDGVDATVLREFGDALRSKAQSAAVVLGSVHDGKPSLLVMLTPDLVQSGLDAAKLAKQLGKEMGAGGGGRPDVATAGGRDPERLDAALAKARELLQHT
ncbi:MAG: alanine--tRNA ligase [Dehalococcoidia bacterium]